MCVKNLPILLANSNQLYFNSLVKTPCHEMPYRCPHRLNLSSHSSRSCAGPNIKMLKDKDLEFANSIVEFARLSSYAGVTPLPPRNINLSAHLPRANRQVAEVAVGADTDPEAHAPVRLRTTLQITHQEHRLLGSADIKLGRCARHFDP